MDFANLSTIEIAAIASASVAVLVILILLTYLLVIRVRRSKNPRGTSLRFPSSASSSRAISHRSPGHRESNRRATSTTWGFGVPAGLPDQPPIAPSPSTGRTQLITPISANSQPKLKKGISWISGKGVRIRNESVSSQSTGSNGYGKSGKVETRSPINLRPESEEMIVITYEEGLAKLGMDRPHHNLYMDEPPPFEIARQAYPVASPRAVPGRSNLQRTSGNAAQAVTAPREVDTDAVRSVRQVVGEREQAARFGRGESPDLDQRNDRIREWVQKPQQALGSGTLTASSASRPGFSRTASDNREYGSRTVRRVAGERERGKMQSTWLPSYYHTPEQRPRDLEAGSHVDLGVPAQRVSPRVLVDRGGRV